jgi:hypothetical protein
MEFTGKNLSRLDNYKYNPNKKSLHHRPVKYVSSQIFQVPNKCSGWSIPMISYLIISISVLLYSLKTPLYQNYSWSQEGKILFFAGNLLLIILYAYYIFSLSLKGKVFYSWLALLLPFFIIFLIIFIYKKIVGNPTSHKIATNIINDTVPRYTRLFNEHTFGPLSSYEQQPKSYIDASRIQN